MSVFPKKYFLIQGYAIEARRNETGQFIDVDTSDNNPHLSWLIRKHIKNHGLTDNDSVLRDILLKAVEEYQKSVGES